MADVQVTFAASIEGLVDGMNSIKQQVAGFAAGLTGIGSALTGIGGGIAAAFAVDKIAAFASSMAELGEKTAIASQILGIPTEAIGALGLVAQAGGTDLDSLVNAFSRMSKNLAVESTQTESALAALGLSLQSFKSLTPEQQLETLAQKFSQSADGAGKDAIAIALFGRAGRQLIPLFNEGAAGIQKWTEEADRFGISLSGPTVDAMLQMRAAQISMGAAMEGAGIQVFMEFQSSMRGVVDEITDLAAAFTQAMQSGGMLKDIMTALGFSAQVVVSAISMIIVAFREMWLAATDTIDAVEILISHLGASIAEMGAGNFAKAEVEWSGFLADLTSRTNDYVADSKAAMKNYMDELNAIWVTGGNKIASTQPKTNLQMAAPAAAQEALEAKITTLNAEVEASKKAEEAQVAHIDALVKMKKLTAEQGLAATVAALNAEVAASMAAYQKEAALVADQPNKLAEILAKEKALQQDATNEIAKLHDKAAEEAVASWNKAFGEINSALTSQIDGLLTGTEKWSQAWKKALTGMIEDAIKFFADLALKQAESVALNILGIGQQTTATIAGQAAQTAAVGAGATARVAESQIGLIPTLINDAKGVFSGIFAFLAPLLGPAAAGPAAAGAALAAAPPGFAEGSWELAGDTFARLHAGEMVVPAAQTPWAQSVLSNAAGGGGDTHHHFSPVVNVSGGGNAQDIADQVKGSLLDLYKYGGLTNSRLRNVR